MTSSAETCSSDTLTTCVQALGLPQVQRHIFLCSDQTKPKCCDKAVGLASWEYLKNRLKELQLDQPTELRPSCIFRTKANCLRVCTQGPIMVIYPDGVWYRNATPELIERIIQEHLIGNQIVQEYAFLIHPLPESVNASIQQTGDCSAESPAAEEKITPDSAEKAAMQTEQILKKN